MLWALAVILVILWLLGYAASLGLLCRRVPPIAIAVLSRSYLRRISAA
jgi:hypothetical protein